MQNYLEIKIPVRCDAKWFSDLRREAKQKKIPVSWQKGHYHITAIFLYDDYKKKELIQAFSHVLGTYPTFTVTLDKVDAFAASKHVIYLTASQPAPDLMSLIDQLRAQATAIGANMREDFRLHITLGKVDKNAATTEQIQALVNNIKVPAFNVQISEVKNLYLGSRISIASWNLKNK